MDTVISIIIANAHVIFRKGLRSVLNEIPFVKIIAEASDGDELFQLLKEEQADIVLMDIHMPETDGTAVIRKLSKKHPNISVICMTENEEIGYFKQMINVGAAGFLLKNTSKEQLEKAIKAVYQGENFYDEEFVIIPKQISERLQKPVILTEKEKEVLDYFCMGYSIVEIAKKLDISKQTVDHHKARLFEKTGVENSTNLIMFAVKSGLVKA